MDADTADTAPVELLKRVRRIQIRAKRLVDQLFLGEYHAVFRGRGLEFSEVREYLPGDDVRIIDWNVTARMGTPYVKKYVEERELTLHFVVDVSGSAAFATAARSKHDLATELVALLGLAAVDNKDRVGLVLFSDRMERYIPPRKGVQHLLRLVRELLAVRPRSGGTDLATALSFVSRVARRRSVLFLISDFHARDYESTLRIVSRRHEVIALSLTDPRERELPQVGLLELEDAETGERAVIDTEDPATRRRFAEGAEQAAVTRRRTLASMGIDEVELGTERPYVGPLLAYFRRRAVRSHRRTYGAAPLRVGAGA